MGFLKNKIDCHQHVNISEFLSAEEEGELAKKIQEDLNDRRSMMASNGIGSAVLMPSSVYVKSKGIDSTRRAQEILLEYQASDPELFPWLGCSVEPQHYSAGGELLSEFLASGCYSLVTWHNRSHGVSADAPIMAELVGIATEYGKPVFLHAAGNLDHEEAWRVARLVKKCPKARFVILDGLMTLASGQVLTDLAQETDNVWLDIANALPVRRVIEEAGKSIGWERIVFGSCFYSSPYSFARCGPLEEFLASPVDDEVRDRVLRQNILTIFDAG